MGKRQSGPKVGTEGMGCGEVGAQNTSFCFVRAPNPFNCWPVNPDLKIEDMA